jgi:beta-lactamase class A
VRAAPPRPAAVPFRPTPNRNGGNRVRNSARGWITLLLLIVVAVVLGVGPGTIGELISGLTYERPPAAAIPVPPAAPTVDDTQFQDRLQGVATSVVQGRFALAAVDLQSGATANVDADRSYPAASLFKLPILIEVLAEEDAGQLDPNRELQIRQDDWTDGSGVLQARVGDELPVQELTRLMIADSDNIAALVLLDVVGVENVNARSESLGLQKTHLVDHRAGMPGDHTTSAADMAHLLVQLATGQAVDQNVSEQALSLLELKQSENWLGADLPFWVKVAHKWGDLPGARNDAGVVYTPRGDYVLVVLSENGEPDAAARAIGQASRVAYDYLGNR